MDLPIDVWRHIISYNNPESDAMLRDKYRDKITHNCVCMYNQTNIEYIKSNFKRGDIVFINDNKLGVIVDMKPTRLAKKSYQYKISYVSVIADARQNKLLTLKHNQLDNRLKNYNYTFLKYNVVRVYANQVEDKHKLLNLKTNRIRKYDKSPDNPLIPLYQNKFDNLKQYDIVKIHYHDSNNINTFNQQLKNGVRIKSVIIVYTGDGRCMTYKDFLEYENPRGIKSHDINRYTKNIMYFRVMDEYYNGTYDDMMDMECLYKNNRYKMRVIKDQEQYYRRRLK